MHRAPRKSLEEGGPRVVRVERLDRAGSRDARDVAEEEDDEREGGQEQVLDLREEPASGGRVGADRAAIEPEREDEDEQDAGDELGDDGEREARRS